MRGTLNPTDRAIRDLTKLREHVQFDHDHAPDSEFRAACASKLRGIDQALARLADGWSPDGIRTANGSDGKRWLPEHPGSAYRIGDDEWKRAERWPYRHGLQG
jgi:hypothetical protein